MSESRTDETAESHTLDQYAVKKPGEGRFCFAAGIKANYAATL